MGCEGTKLLQDDYEIKYSDYSFKLVLYEDFYQNAIKEDKKVKEKIYKPVEAFLVSLQTNLPNDLDLIFAIVDNISEHPYLDHYTILESQVFKLVDDISQDFKSLRKVLRIEDNQTYGISGHLSLKDTPR